MNDKHRAHAEAADDLEVEFARLSPIYGKWVGLDRLRLIIQQALDNNECVLCKIAELKERGEIKYPSRCATHYDRSLLTELAVGGYRCKVCDQYVWARETQPQRRNGP